MGPGKTCWAPTGPVCSHAAGEEGQAELLGSSCSPEASVKAELNPDLQLFWLREDLGMELLSAGARQDCSELQQLLGLRLLPFLDSPTAAAARLFQPGPSAALLEEYRRGWQKLFCIVLSTGAIKLSPLGWWHRLPHLTATKLGLHVGRGGLACAL